MKVLQLLVVEMVFLASFSSTSKSSCLQGKEDIFTVKDYFSNEVYADGKLAKSFTIDIPTIIFGFCIPREAKLIAVTNTRDHFPYVAFFGSIGERLVTNNEWKCVNNVTSVDWYQPWFNDTDWPYAYSKKTPTTSPFISMNAQDISSVQNTSHKYYCRGKVKPPRPNVAGKDTPKCSAITVKIARNQRLMNHAIKSFQVRDIFNCLTHCLDSYQDCVSVNFEDSHKQAQKICELNNKTDSDFPQDSTQSDQFSYYEIINP